MRRKFLYESASARVIVAAAFGFAALPTAAQDVAQDAPRQLPALSVEGQLPLNNSTDYKVDNPSLPKLTEPLRNTPQSIDVVPRQMIDDRGATTLNDAVRTVPGVSLAAGEGGNQGSSLTLRGFTARGDIFLDGMRDFGSYYRDPFNLDQVEVLKGPASMLFGRGSTGGVVNQASKMPDRHGFTAGAVTFGTDFTKRITLDYDTPVEDIGITGAAFRFNAMANQNNVAGRDQAEFQRFGVAPSVAFGLGTATRTTVSYFHQQEDNTPDYGFPRYFTGAPPMPPVDANNFYGFANDFLRTNVDVVTGRIEHDVNSWLTVRDQLRFANYERKFRITEPQIPGGVTPFTPLSAINLTRNMIIGDSVETFLQNQTDAVANFNTWDLKHTAVGGIEIGRETSDPSRFNTTPAAPAANLLAPGSSIEYHNTALIRANPHTEAQTAAAYFADTVKIGEMWEVSGGGRYDRFAADFEDNVTNVMVGRTDNLLSWRAGLVFKPMPIGSIYFGWGTSFQPSAESLSLSPSTINTPPEKSETFEFGTKWDVIQERLMLRAAIFRTDKTDVRVTDPNDSTQQVLGGSQRVDGFEIEGAGRVTRQWQVFLGYAYLDGEVTKAPPGGFPIEGAPLQNVPKHSFHLWSTYDLPYRFQVGGGINYVSERVARNTPVPFANNSIVDGYVTVDAMVKYGLTENVDIQLNAINLFDEFYIDQPHPNHYIPGAGRTFLLTTEFKF